MSLFKKFSQKTNIVLCVVENWNVWEWRMVKDTIIPSPFLTLIQICVNIRLNFPYCLNSWLIFCTSLEKIVVNVLIIYLMKVHSLAEGMNGGITQNETAGNLGHIPPHRRIFVKFYLFLLYTSTSGHKTRNDCV